MNQNTTAKLTCILTCWIIAALIGVIVAAILKMLLGFALMAGIFLGLLTFLVAGLFLGWAFCRDIPAPMGGVEPTRAPGEKPTLSAASHDGSAGASSASAAAAMPAGVMSTAASGAADATAEVKPAAKPKPAAKKKASTAKPKTTKAASKAPKTESKAKGSKDSGPTLYDAPQDGKADDLKQIKGVGPQLEKTLNEMGIWHFSQVASWKKKDVAWVDARLKFKGRIERDDWISQAKTLAAGGSTEFSKRVDEGDVY